MDYSYVGSGRTYMREFETTGPWVEVGNASALALGISEDKKSIQNFMAPGGGTFNEIRRITAVELNMSLAEISPANLERALYGTMREETGGADTDVAIGNAYRDSFLPLPGVNDADVAPVIQAVNGDAAVTRANSTAYALGVYMVPATPNGWYYKVTTAGTSAASPPTFPTTVAGTVTDGTAVLTTMGKVVLVADTDYTIRTGGIYIAVAANVTAGEPLETDYTTATHDVVEALTNAGKEFEIIFQGINEARSPGKVTQVHMYRVRIGAASSLPFIGDDYLQLEITGTLLPDTSIVATNESQYFKVSIEQ
jgi:hypothetical protein